MKREELEKEAEEYAEGMAMYYESAHGSIPSQFEKYLRNAYISSAKPREKQIKIDAEQIRALQKQNGELTDKVKKLEAQIEKMKCDVLSLIKDRMNDDIDQNIIERLAEKWEIKEK